MTKHLNCSSVPENYRFCGDPEVCKLCVEQMDVPGKERTNPNVVGYRVWLQDGQGKI